MASRSVAGSRWKEETHDEKIQTARPPRRSRWRHVLRGLGSDGPCMPCAACLPVGRNHRHHHLGRCFVRLRIKHGPRSLLAGVHLLGCVLRAPLSDHIDRERPSQEDGTSLAWT